MAVFPSTADLKSIDQNSPVEVASRVPGPAPLAWQRGRRHIHSSGSVCATLYPKADAPYLKNLSGPERYYWCLESSAHPC